MKDEFSRISREQKISSITSLTLLEFNFVTLRILQFVYNYCRRIVRNYIICSLITLLVGYRLKVQYSQLLLFCMNIIFSLA